MNDLEKSNAVDNFDNKLYYKFEDEWVEKLVIGKALHNCKKKKPCLIEKIIYGDNPSKLTKTCLYLLKKDVKENEPIYLDDQYEVNYMCKELFKLANKTKLSPTKLFKFLVQKHNTEKIINS